MMFNIGCKMYHYSVPYSSDIPATQCVHTVYCTTVQCTLYSVHCTVYILKLQSEDTDYINQLGFLARKQDLQMHLLLL